MPLQNRDESGRELRFFLLQHLCWRGWGWRQVAVGDEDRLRVGTGWTEL